MYTEAFTDFRILSRSWKLTVSVSHITRGFLPNQFVREDSKIRRNGVIHKPRDGLRAPFFVRLLAPPSTSFTLVETIGITIWRCGLCCIYSLRSPDIPQRRGELCVGGRRGGVVGTTLHQPPNATLLVGHRSRAVHFLWFFLYSWIEGGSGSLPVRPIGGIGRPGGRRLMRERVL